MSARVSAVFLGKMLQLKGNCEDKQLPGSKPVYIWGPFLNQKGRTKTISICLLIVGEDINRNEPASVLGYEFNKVNANNIVSLPLLLSLLQDVITCVTCTSSSLWGNHLILCTVHSYCFVFCYTPLSEAELKGVFSNVSWLGGSVLSGKDKHVSSQPLVWIACRKILKGRGSS